VSADIEFNDKPIFSSSSFIIFFSVPLLTTFPSFVALSISCLYKIAHVVVTCCFSAI
jgi:hypothetical protein